MTDVSRSLAAHAAVRENNSEWNSVTVESGDGKAHAMAITVTYGYDDKAAQLQEVNEFVKAISGVSNARAERDQGRGGR